MAEHSDTQRLDWLLPNLHPANFGLEFQWDNEAEFLRKWRSAIDAEIAAAAYGKTNHTEKHTVSEADIDAEIRRSGCLRTDENRVVVRARLEHDRDVRRLKSRLDRMYQDRQGEMDALGVQEDRK